MTTTIYKHLFYSAQKLKQMLGINNFEAFKKKQKRKIFRIRYKKKFNVHNIIDVMKSMGMKRGSVIFIHCSMTEFYNYTGTAKELIHKIIEEIGEEGTLMMPAFPEAINDFDDEVNFDVLNSPSGAGYLSEVFRRLPGVVRSVNLQHSICAYGKLANELVSEHYKSQTAWDEFSPYYKMSQIHTLVFAFGLPYFLGTIIHCTESILRQKYQYFEMFFKKEMNFKYRDAQGNIGESNYLIHDFARRRSKKRIIQSYFDKREFKKTNISNLSVEVVDATYTLNLYLSLAERGITMYSVPSPKKFLDENGKFIKL